MAQENQHQNQQDLYSMGRRMTNIRELINDPRKISVASAAEKIRNVCMIVVEKYKFKRNEKLTKQFLNLGVVSSGKVGSLHLDVIKVAESKV